MFLREFQRRQIIQLYYVFRISFPLCASDFNISFCQDFQLGRCLLKKIQGFSRQTVTQVSLVCDF